MLSITLPDGSQKDLPKGSTGLDLAKTIGPGLAKSAVAISIDGVQKDLKDKINATNGVNVLAEKISGVDADSLKNIALQLRKEVENSFIILGAEDKEMALLALAISENIIESKSLSAAEIIRKIAPEIKGGGGGQPFFATAGGPNAAGLSAAFKKALSFL